MINIAAAEDNPLDQALLREEFTKQNEEFSLEIVANGQQLLKRLEIEPLPHVVLLDMDMPIINGFEVLETLKGSDRLAKLPVFVMSSSDFHEEDLLNEGCPEGIFLRKPVSAESLKTALAKA